MKKCRVLALSICFTLIFSNLAFAKQHQEFIKSTNEKIIIADEIQPKVNSEMSTNSTEDLSESSMYPDILSSYANKIGFLEIYLMNSEYEVVKGIKVNKIKMEQSNRTIFETNNVKSYSKVGRYTAQDIQLVNAFESPNGENIVNVILYLFDKEVARISNYKINVYSEKVVKSIYPRIAGKDTSKLSNHLSLLNCSDSDDVKVYVLDNNNNVVVNYENEISKYYNESAKELYIQSKLLIVDAKCLETENHDNYTTLVKVNGINIPFKNAWSERFMFTNECRITSYGYWPIDDKKFCILEGANILYNGPYSFEIEQNGVILGKVNNVNPVFNEDTYTIELKFDITDYIKDESNGFITYLRDKNDVIVDTFTWDFTVEEPDIITPGNNEYDFSDAINLGTKEIINPMKEWSILFNKEVDINSLNLNDILLLDDNNNIVNVTFKIEESNNKIVKIIPPSNGYMKNTKYTIAVRDIGSVEGKSLNKTYIMNFYVK